MRTPLIDGFVSRQSAAEVEAKLQQSNAKFAVVEDSKDNEKGSVLRVPLSIRVLVVTGFTYLGMPGDLRLEFVNDELATTWFFPADTERFQAELGKRWPDATSGRPMRLHAASELRTSLDYQGKRYWAWEDLNLRQEVERWIKQNT